MTNYEYYGGLSRLKFERFNLFSYNNDYSGLKISYVPKHSDEEIDLLSKLVKTEDLVNEKAKWLLQEVEFPYANLQIEHLINDDTMYVPRHALHS